MEMKVEGDSTWERPLARTEGGVSFWNNMLVRTLISAILLMILVNSALLFFFIRPSETPIVLHYNVYFGVDLLGIWWQAYMLPVLGLLFFGGHVLLARRFYERTERIACHLMLLSATFLSLGLLIAGVSVSFINY